MEGVQLKTTTFGAMRVSAIRARHADALVAHIAATRGDRTGRYAMQVGRRIWYEAARDSGGGNPFARMGLSNKATKGNRPTSRAEYDAYREQARSMGRQSMATAAALAFELVRRASDVFGYVTPGEDPGGIYWEDYEAGETILLRQHKTGAVQVLPLADDEGLPLYPDLEAELERTPRGRPDIEIDGRPMTPIVVDEETGKRYLEDRSRRVFRNIRDKAKLPAEMSLTGFRHGGATELGDAGVDDIRPVSGHVTREMADVYDKVTIAKARRAGQKRRAMIEAAPGFKPAP
jgi:hypothetical protein